MSKKAAKQYVIRNLKKCDGCDQTEDCAYLKRILEKPFDAGGVILDCKAFYFVFCQLEGQCHFSFDKSEKLHQQNEESEAEITPYLHPALVTNGMLAVELALKALTLSETGAFDCTHKIDQLFNALPENHRIALSALLKEKAHQNDETLQANLKTIGNFFIEWRYFFEYESVGYSGFLLDLIHIVCDYAISKLSVSD